MGLSPNNKFLAVGGEHQDIFIWCLTEKKLLRKFKGVSDTKLLGLHKDDSNQSDAYMNGEEEDTMEVFDIGWSCDGGMVAAGLQRSLLILDVNKILQQPPEQMMMAADARFKGLREEEVSYNQD